jgi:hypothetical protein
MPEKDDKNKGKKLVVCPECDTQCDVNDDEECPTCGLNVFRVYEQLRYRRALKKLERDDDEGEKKKKTPSGWNPFGSGE